ncbi:glutamine-hydrolyzing carbamoyl-phosphate synthase small subunit [Nakamurella deserti]|uniref:glutamine-hydrolyzing carbamoyl-phosphate synthase small subunit n=1 Tax=Nakamurella deserti TaxID=2164074 RepID=UPI000DBE01C4|nr:glutamine-hydrolyzing carbamoyl-phosphate synthase small subunit [Nakamurella deserti]
MTHSPAVLVLEDGRVFGGSAFGATGTAFGEAVFATGMTGYQETLTDPSYRRQVVVATAPQIGNTGWVPEDDESAGIQVAGFVVRDLSPAPSNWRASHSLPDAMTAQGVVGISGIDTRALTRHLRSRGAMRCGIFTGDAVVGTDDMVAAVREIPDMAGLSLTDEVSTTETYTVPAQGEPRFSVAAVDLGIKANTPRSFAARGITTHVVPASVTLEEILALGVDGVFLSNGPGDPATADHAVALTRQILERRIPLFGICFGNQILGRALGFGTYKLKFGHRGINQPVVDHHTGATMVTSQNHGFAVDAPAGEDLATGFGTVRVGFSSLNDGVVEGLTCLDVPAFSVQFHPEAAAGPHDAGYLFDRFIELLELAAAAPADTVTASDVKEL